MFNKNKSYISGSGVKRGDLRDAPLPQPQRPIKAVTRTQLTTQPHTEIHQTPSCVHF